MPKEKPIKEVIHAKDTEIAVLSYAHSDDYISLTDIAKHKNPEFPADVVKNWLRIRSTIEFLGLWEELNNPNFNMVEFDQFKIGIIQFFPQAYKLYCVFPSKPIFNNICGLFRIFVSRNIGQREIIVFI